MKINLVVITDTHYVSEGPAPRPAGLVADVLLLRAVRRINRFIRPDAVLLLGDLVNNPVGPGYEAELLRLRETLDLLKCPWIAVPGNHDGDVERFYRVMPDPGPWRDVGGFRFLPFVHDREEPEFNATRLPEDIGRLAVARAGYAGPIVALQHISLHPPGSDVCPYNLLNAAETLAAMNRHGVRLSLGGHYHPGIPLMSAGAVPTLTAPGLVEPPFPFLEIRIDDDRTDVIRHELKMPAELELTDYHVHTQFAYCSENMNMAGSVDLARRFGLAGMVFTEHATHLYLSREQVGSDIQFRLPIDSLAGAASPLVREYFEAAQAVAPSFARAGLEVECAYDGSPFVRAEDLARCQVRIGAIHRLPELMKSKPDIDKACDEYLAMLALFLKSGIQVLAHPFRVFRRRDQSVPPRLFLPVCRMLRESGVAAELNFHANRPPPVFVRQCIEAGVKLTFGSDAHNMYEVGEFAPQLALLRSLGYAGDIRELLARL
jgi:histidinol phosphatase-like PHP family hydrolase